MDDHVVDKRSLGIKQRGVLRLADSQPRRIIHGDVLHRGQRLRPGQANVSHVADVEDAYAGAHSHVLGNDSAAQ